MKLFVNRNYLPDGKRFPIIRLKGLYDWHAVEFPDPDEMVLRFEGSGEVVMTQQGPISLSRSVDGRIPAECTLRWEGLSQEQVRYLEYVYKNAEPLQFPVEDMGLLINGYINSQPVISAIPGRTDYFGNLSNVEVNVSITYYNMTGIVMSVLDNQSGPTLLGAPQRSGFSGEYASGVVISGDKNFYSGALDVLNGHLWPIEGTFAVGFRLGALNLTPTRTSLCNEKGQSVSLSLGDMTATLKIERLASSLDANNGLVTSFSVGSNASETITVPSGAINDMAVGVLVIGYEQHTQLDMARLKPAIAMVGPNDEQHFIEFQEYSGPINLSHKVSVRSKIGEYYNNSYDLCGEWRLISGHISWPYPYTSGFVRQLLSKLLEESKMFIRE